MAGTDNCPDAQSGAVRDPSPQPPGLYMVGLGLGDADDITVRGLRVIQNAHTVFLEAYTSVLSGCRVDADGLTSAFNLKRSIQVADRELVEEKADAILQEAEQPGGAAFLVVGDPLGATTHADLWLRAKQRGLDVTIVHNASIMNAVAACGLQLYRFGEAVSLCMWTETWTPDSYYSKIVTNRKAGLHTLCLLDIKVKEPTMESLARGKKEYAPPRYMTIAEAIEQLLVCEERYRADICVPDALGVGLARVGQIDQLISSGTLEELRGHDFGPPLHSLVIPAGELHFHEQQVLSYFAVAHTTAPKLSSTLEQTVTQ